MIWIICLLAFGICLVSISLVAVLYFIVKEHREANNKLINAVIAKNTTEMHQLALADNTKINLEHSPPPVFDDDLVPMNLATDKQFEAALKYQLEDEANGSHEEDE